MARILIIDDEKAVRTAMRTILEQAGHDVVEAMDGAQGIEIFEGGEVALVITDLYMPGKEGMETIQELTLSGRPVPILAVSGHGVAPGGVLDDAELLGASATLSKPFTVAELKEAVALLLMSEPQPKS